MSQGNSETIQERLEKLERQNRWMKLAGGVLLLGLIGVLPGACMQKEPTGLIEARRIILRDHNGAIRTVLGVQENGSTFLSLRDESEIPRILLSAGESRPPILTLSDATGIPRVTVSANPEGVDGPLLSLWGANGQIRAALAAAEDGATALVLADRDGKNNALLSSDLTSPSLVFHDNKSVLWQAP